jgi:Protein of unknown function (DUF3108).
MKILVFVCFLWFGFQCINAQCVDKVNIFKPGEIITYDAYYNWGFVWIHAGNVQFSVSQKTYLGKNVFSFDANGSSLKSYDWLYKVRDRFQSLVDMQSFSPMWAERNTEEGSNKAFENYSFLPNGKIYTTVTNSSKPLKRDSLKAPACTFDVLSLIYYCRSISFDKYKPKDKIPLRIVLAGQLYSLYIRYLGKETINNRDGNSYRCVKFSALLVEGTIFKGGEDMFIWVTDDDNRIPVLVEAKILIGSVKACLNKIEGASYPVRAIVK